MDNIIQDQMVIISKAMFKIIIVINITNVIIVKIIDFDRME